MHIFSMKGKTKKLEIKPLKAPSTLHVPLLQHIGVPAEPLVQIGDKVKKYQLIGRASSTVSANVHSPVSGTVTDISDCKLADGTPVPSITIQNDWMDDESTLLDSDTEIVEIIRNSGIVGEGGAQFPTDVKYNLGDNEIHTFIINGTECEPYLTADYALMAQYTEQLLKGICYANKIIKAKDVVITIEEQNKELINKFTPHLSKNEYKHIRIVVLPNEYPQGGELQLIKSITGIELPRAKRPKEVGVIVNNVGTIYAIYQAIEKRQPVISRFITVSGEKAERYGNYEVLIGTPISHILNELGISAEGKTTVLGGPMMGKSVVDINAPVIKGSSGLLLLKKDKKQKHNCISCGYCVDVCPMHLMPMKFEQLYSAGKYFKLEEYSVSNCIECGACEYICPSNVPLIESIKRGKNELKKLANAIE